MEDSRKSQIIPVKIGWADLKHRYWHNRYNHRLVLVGCEISNLIFFVWINRCVDMLIRATRVHNLLQVVLIKSFSDSIALTFILKTQSLQIPSADFAKS